MSILSWMRSKKMFVVGAALVVGVSVLSGCGGSKDKASTGSVAMADTLYIGMANAPEFFNPILHPGIAGKFAVRFMYDSLLGMPEANKFTPKLADSFETTDNQTYTIKLNPKAKWTDGTPITAEDVAFTLTLIADPKVETSKKSYIKMLEGLDDNGTLPDGVKTISGVVVKDAQTLTLKMKTPSDPDYIKGVLGFEVFIVPKHIFEKIDPAAVTTSEAATKPSVTSGPYKFVTYKTNDHVEYAANEDYYLGKPKISKIFIRIMNGTNLVTALKSGDIHMVAGGGVGIVPVKDLAMLQKDDKLYVKAAPAFTGQYLEANNENPAFNAKFRNALTAAINRQQIVD